MGNAEHMLQLLSLLCQCIVTIIIMLVAVLLSHSTGAWLYYVHYTWMISQDDKYELFFEISGDCCVWCETERIWAWSQHGGLDGQDILPQVQRLIEIILSKVYNLGDTVRRPLKLCRSSEAESWQHTPEFLSSTPSSTTLISFHLPVQRFCDINSQIIFD